MKIHTILFKRLRWLAEKLGRARQLELLAGIRVDYSEGHRCLVCVGIVQGVPESVALAEELVATDLVPVLLGIRRAGNGLVVLWAASRPSLRTVGQYHDRVSALRYE